MKIFIPINETNTFLINEGFTFNPLIIEAYRFHVDESLGSEKTQNLFNKKVKIGTVITRNGKTLVE
jgi:hypothetical protein